MKFNDIKVDKGQSRLVSHFNESIIFHEAIHQQFTGIIISSQNTHTLNYFRSIATIINNIIVNTSQQLTTKCAKKQGK